LEYNPLENGMKMRKNNVTFSLNHCASKTPENRAVMSDKGNGYQAIEIAEGVKM